MDTRELAKIDLNLLLSLQVLLEERSVSRAAERLFITQPAMSKTLSRLRTLFSDPLFTRASHGIQPTPRALELSLGLADVLGDISRLVAGTQFEPTTFDGEVTLALSEYIGMALLPALTHRLQVKAPRLSIRVITRVENQLEQLALGKLDFAIQIKQTEYTGDYRVMHLGSSPPALLARESHPLTRGAISWESLGQYPVIRLYIPDWEQAEIQRSYNPLAPLARRQRGSLEISHLLTALEVLRQTDYFMPAPVYILQNEDATRGITALPFPLNEDYTLDYALVAHERTAHSPLHSWLWQEITCTIRDLRTPLPRKLRQRFAAGSNDPAQQ